MSDLYLKAYDDCIDYGPGAHIAILRERFVPRVPGPHDGLIERLEYCHEHGVFDAARVNRQATYGEAAAAIQTQPDITIC